MVEDAHIKQWLSEGLISGEQAQRMQADVLQSRKERASDRLVVVMATVGAVLLGIGAILFIASNWRVLTDTAKLAIAVCSTFGAAAAGYVLAYEQRAIPKVGAALLLLGTLLFGASLMLIGQIYHVQANSHALVLWWLIGVAPLVYVLAAPSLAGLTALLWFIWIGLFVFHNPALQGQDWRAMPALFLLAGVLTFEIGSWHYAAPRLAKVARVYRIGALKVIMVTLFFLTFRAISGIAENWWGWSAGKPLSQALRAGMLAFGIPAALLAAATWMFNPSKSQTITVEGVLSSVLVAMALLFAFIPPTNNLYVLMFNALLAGCIAALIAIGYRREDIQLVNLGMSYLAIFILIRYFDFFWGLLSRSVFFMVGGAILVMGGIALERKRRELKAKFTTA